MSRRRTRLLLPNLIGDPLGGDGDEGMEIYLARVSSNINFPVTIEAYASR